MKASDLNLVNKITSALSESIEKHAMLKNILSSSAYSQCNIPHSVKIEIGGDQYGNGRYKTVTASVQDVEFVVRLLSKEISDEWGKIVIFRARLRELGVNIDGVDFGK